MDLTFDIQHNSINGEIKLLVNNVNAGKVSFKFLQNSVIEIDHTEVFSSFAGLGYGKILIEEAVGFARRNKLKILPTCEFAKKVLTRQEYFDDVVE